MAGDTKDVELRIRARDYRTKTLDQVADALQELEKAQTASSRHTVDPWVDP